MTAPTRHPESDQSARERIERIDLLRQQLRLLRQRIDEEERRLASGQAPTQDAQRQPGMAAARHPTDQASQADLPRLLAQRQQVEQELATLQGTLGVERGPVSPAGADALAPTGVSGLATPDARAGAPAAGSPAAVSRPDEATAQHGPITAYIYFVAFLAALGGLLFGYDTGVVSGAQHYFAAEFRFSASQQEFVVSAVLIGAMIGALIAGRMADLMGRKRWLILMAIVFGAGAILTAAAWGFASLVGFRILIGIGVGGASVVAPMYTAERVPARVRGQLVFLFQLAITFGILVAYIIDLWFASAGWGWRPMFGVAIFPALALGLGMLFLSDTPRWYASKGRWNEATSAMYQASGSETETAQEMRRIRTGLEQEGHARPTELLRPGLRIALVVGVGMAILQQLVGINTIIYYAPVVLGYSGFGTAGNSLIGALVVGIVNFLTTIVAVFLVDRVGRRPLLLLSSIGMFITLVIVGALFALGPRQHGMALVISVMLYIISFAIGFGPVFWLMSSEVFPNRLRASGESASTLANWVANFGVSVTFLTLIGGIGATYTFWIYAFFAIVTIVFVWFLVPETKDKNLEQIEVYWQNGRRWEATEATAEGQRAS